MDSVLRPREIQARIRAGATPESVAAAAGTSVEKIMGFAAPALAERAYIAEQAQRASVRRRVGDGPAGRLGEAVAARLASDQLDAAAVEWDAWRREDGRWTVRAELPGPQAGAAAAEFTYDAAGRYVVAEDEASRRLVGERLTPGPSEPSLASPGLAAVTGPAASAPTEDGQLPLGDDAIELVTGRRPTPLTTPADTAATAATAATEPSSEEATVDLTDAVSGMTGLTASGTVPAPARTGDDWMLTQASPRPEPVADEDPQEEFEGLTPVVAQAAGRPAARPAPRAVPKTASRAARGRGRAQVPSWDEIMFGSSRSE